MNYKIFTGWLIGLVLISLSLAACGGGSTAESSEAPADTPLEESAAETAPETEATPVETANEEAGAETEAFAGETETDEVAESTEPGNLPQPDTVVSAAASCQSVDIPENPLIAAVTENDWARGPADAPITIIEYGDFQ